MEIVLNITTENIARLVNYYCNVLDLFEIEYYKEEGSSASITYKLNPKIILNFEFSEIACELDISLEVENAEILFDYIRDLSLLEGGIVHESYIHNDQRITFLTSPVGNFFYTQDPDGNKIQFFDKTI